MTKRTRQEIHDMHDALDAFLPESIFLAKDSNQMGEIIKKHEWLLNALLAAANHAEEA